MKSNANLLPILSAATINVSGYCGPLEEIIIRLSIQKDFYACGDSVHAVICIENKTHFHTVHEIGVALMQDIHVSAEGHEKIQTKTIVFQKISANLHHGKSEEIMVALEVPKHLPPTQESRLISIRYRISSLGDKSHFTSQPSIPITIVG